MCNKSVVYYIFTGFLVFGCLFCILLSGGNAQEDVKNIKLEQIDAQVHNKIINSENENTDDNKSSPTNVSNGYDFFLKRVDIVLSCIVLLVAVMTGVNGYLTVKKSSEFRDEMKRLDAYKEKVEILFSNLDKEYSNRIRSLEEYSKDLKEAIFQDSYEEQTISKYRNELLEILHGDEPELERVYPLLCNIINFPSEKNMKIYYMCLDRFQDAELIRVVTRGLSRML